MEKYCELQWLGDGSFGVVHAARHKLTGELVAVKKLKKRFLFSLEDCLRDPEVETLSKLKHPNIVQFKEVFKRLDNLFLVFELMEDSLFDVLWTRQNYFTEDQVRDMCCQILRGLDYMHKNGYFHRDLKPGNLMVKQGVVKIGDLGSAMEIKATKPLEKQITTLWYRAPEMLLESELYGPKVDMWAMGAIMAELFALRPLFPGGPKPIHQLRRIINVIGSPTLESWPEGICLAKENLKLEFQRFDGGLDRLSSLMPLASDSALNLISSLCSWDPVKRPTAEEALKHPFFSPCYQIPRPIALRPAGWD